jgi:hypothetical protein
MPPKKCDSAVTPIDSLLEYQACPKCGFAMEPIDTGVDGPPVKQLQLCPACYLVTWSDQDGLHARQGVPVKKGVSPQGESKGSNRNAQEC